MKTTNSKWRADAARAAKNCRLFFFCGPDEAGASRAADGLVATLPDAGERVELAGGDLRADPARLGDEARSTSLFGGARHIVARVQGEEALEALRALVETQDAGGGECCPVIVIATGATDKSRTARLLEKRKDALVAMFWPADLRSVTAEVRTMGEAVGLRMADDLAQRLAAGARLDVRLARSEIEKLALYLDASAQSPRNVSPEDLDAIATVSEDSAIQPIVSAALSGDVGRLPRELARMRELSLNAVGIALALERRIAQLARIRAMLGPGGSVQRLSRQDKASLGIFGREEQAITAELARWPARGLARLAERAVSLHRAMFADSRTAELLLAHELTEIARAAARR